MKATIEKTGKIGKINKMTHDAYLAHEALSASQVKLLLDNPHLFLRKEPMVQTPDMLLGSVIHSLVLEPESFDTIYAVMPKLDARTKAGKEEKQAFEEAHEGKVILTDALFDTAQSCAEAITSSSANALLQNGVAEASFFGQLEGYDAKCRPDYYCRERSLIIDIKKTTDASPEGFTRADANFKYYIQAAWYLDVLKSIGEPVKDFLFIAVEATAPFMVGIYRLADSAIEFGRLKYREALKTYRNINDFAKPIYRDTETRKYIQTIDLPAYVYAQNKNSNLMEVYHG